MGYKILYIDSPWHYKDDKSGLAKLGGKSYATMKDADLALLPFHRVMDEDSLCFTWLVMPKLLEGLQILQAWGYTPVTCGFIWVKLNRNGIIKKVGKDILLQGGVYSGLGSYVCGNVEICYIGKRGKGVPRLNKSVKQIIFAPVSRHSAKPIEAYERIETLYGDVPKLEVFARNRREGWDSTGFDVDGVDIREFLNEPKGQSKGTLLTFPGLSGEGSESFSGANQCKALY